MSRFLIALTLCLCLSSEATAQLFNNPTGRLRAGPTLPATCVSTTHSIDVFYQATTATVALYICTATNTWTVIATGTAGSNPFSDATAIVKNASDATKLFRVDASGIATGTTLTLLGRPSGLGLGTAGTADATADSLFAASAIAQSPLVLEAKASQTGDIFRARRSDGTLKMTVDNLGNIMLSSDMCVGWDSATSITGNFPNAGNGGICKTTTSSYKIFNNLEAVSTLKSNLIQSSAGSGQGGVNMLSSGGEIWWTSVSLHQVNPQTPPTPTGLLVVGNTGNDYRDFGARHFVMQALTGPTIGGSCGSSPSIAGTDAAGTITAGTGSPTSCTVTFNVAFANAPACTANAQTTTTSLNVATTTTTAIISSVTLTAGEKINYICVGF